MGGFLFWIGSAAPIILLVAGAFAIRRWRTGRRIALQLALLVASAPLGAWIIGQALPPLRGEHTISDNAGQGVAYAFLLVAWLLCLTSWLVLLAMAVLNARGRRRSPRS
jgi:hypothetical protein